MFRAQDGYVLVGADYSAQEPRLTAHLSNDTKMITAYNEGKDVYCEIASISFNKPYEECQEFRADGSTNDEGKERRSQAKKIVLGVLYGRQIQSIAEQLGVTEREAQVIYDKVMWGFPQLAEFIKESQTQARELGYVTTAWGRRRHLPDMQLPTYEFSYKSEANNFDPLSFNGKKESNEVPKSVQTKYLKALKGAKYFKDKQAIINGALSEGIVIKSNERIIGDAERQCVNARVQGSAGDLTKLAMIKIGNDERMKELDFHLLLTIHDELIGECPRENAKECGERLSMLMRTAADGFLKIPLKCDVDITTNWYGEELCL